MKKFLTLTALVLAAALFTAGCSSKPETAEGLYNNYVAKYHVELADMTNAFGGAATATSFQDYVKGLDDCNLMTDADAIGMITLMVGPTLVKNGHDVTSFIKDTNDLIAQTDKEGLCPKV